MALLDRFSIQDVVIKPRAVAEIGQSLSEAIALMARQGIRELPVVDGRGKLVGYLSYKTLLRRRSLAPTAKVENVMLSPPRVREDEPLTRVVELMVENGLRAIPVVDRRGRLLGLVTRESLISVLPSIKPLAEKAAAEVMTENPIYVSEHDPVVRAIELMQRLGELTIPVVKESGSLLGQVRIDDAARALWRERERQTMGEVSGESVSPKVTCGSVAVPVASCRPEDPLGRVVELMQRFSSDICVVVDEDERPVGVIATSDLMDLLVEPHEGRRVYVTITGLHIEHPTVYDEIYRRLQPYVTRLGKMGPGIPTSLSVHFEATRKSGTEAFYEVRVKLVTTKGVYTARSSDWNPMIALKEAMEILEDRIRREKKGKSRAS